ncbi:MAG: hypothetical protein L6R42_001583 [Xanthoria sp. 1 TBL-2021]|nr:MAG: hypothetical protein L6R42_001583 [Xanthoria sp. 1 TBL-2021]
MGRHRTTTIQPTIAVTNTVTITIVDPSTVGVTITATGPTTTIPASAGFIPASSAPNLRKRESQARANLLAGNRPELAPRAITTAYPTTVSCGVLVKIIATELKTVTGTKTATVTASPSTVTKVIPVTYSVTKTVCPAGASTTTTVTTTLAPITSFVPVTTTTTTTATLTFTIQEPESTYYAACGPENLLTNDQFEGGNLTQADPQVYGWARTSVAESAYDCCAQCIVRGDLGVRFDTDLFAYVGRDGMVLSQEERDRLELPCGGGFFRTDGSNECVLADTRLDLCNAAQPNVAVRGDPNSPSLLTAFSSYCGSVEGSRFYEYFYAY